MPISKKLYSKIGKYNVYTVNAEKIRDSSLSNEQFGEYGSHLLYPHLIPENDIWLDSHLDENDREAVLKNALTQYQAREAGLDKNRAYLKGLKVEKAEREKLTGYIKKPHLPNTPPAAVYLKLLTIISAPTDNSDTAVEVWLVNSEYVRNLYQTTFTEGSNGYAVAYIPENQIFLDNTLVPAERAPTLIHEYVERYLMKFKNMKYKEAHQYASKVEYHWRPKAPPLDVISEELSPDWVKQQVKIIA